MSILSSKTIYRIASVLLQHYLTSNEKISVMIRCLFLVVKRHVWDQEGHFEWLGLKVHQAYSNQGNCFYFISLLVRHYCTRRCIEDVIIDFIYDLQYILCSILSTIHYIVVFPAQININLRKGIIIDLLMRKNIILLMW